MQSSYPHGYSYDLFVSYSTRDLEWVRVFQDDLVADVNRFADHDVYSFFDKARLQPGYLWDEKLTAAASDSAIFIPILTPRFFQSEPCQKELNAFTQANRRDSGLAHRSRIMPVKLLCSAPSDHPLAQVQHVSFCTERIDEIPFEYQPGTTEYKESLRKLAYEMAHVLKAIPPKQQARSIVYVASDFQPSSDKLRASLEHHFDVLPANPTALLGLSADEFQNSLKRDFPKCFVSVHPLGKSVFAKSVVEAQLEFARKQSKPRLVWAQEQPNDLTNSGFEWFTSQADIEERIRRLYQKPPEVKSSGSERLIYFICSDRGNKTLAEPLLETLEKSGVHVYPSPLEGAPDQALQAHVRALDELDGCLIYYGDVQRDWFDAVFLRVQKKIRQRHLLSAIFVAPPSLVEKAQDLHNVGVQVVEAPDAAVKLFLGGAP
ncbi:MAG TPA: toll/interleukin-1 receptor domain-containing protein [Terriglobales bacterium]